MSSYTYQEIHCPPELISPRLKSIHPMCLDILYKRGVRTTAEMEEFLFPVLHKALQKAPPLLDQDKAVKLLASALKKKLPITIYHDYDVDGITAAAIAADLLGMLGATVHWYCNDRAIDGFGICPNGVDNLLTLYPDTKLLMTVDNGVSGIAGVARAKEAGLQVIVTDHHEPDGELPAADAVVDPKRRDEPAEQYKDSCGAGVIWKVMMALYIRMGRDVAPVLDALDLVALGTVADVVPLFGENRAMVQEGLRHINDSKRPFFQAVMEVMELAGIDAQTIAYRIAPSINAVSRMGEDPHEIVDLMLSKDLMELRQGVAWLDGLNMDRRELTEEQYAMVEEAIASQPGKAAVVFKDDTLSEGIVGIVAGRVKDNHTVPAAIFCRGKDGNWKGSCRAPDGFHLKEALDQCAEFLVTYGGHEKAAGATVRADAFEDFKARFEALAEEKKAGFKAEVAIDAVLPAGEYTEDMVRELSLLEPFGEGFPPLLFGLVADVVDTRYMGQEQQHVKYVDRCGMSIIQWNNGDKARGRKTPPRKFVGTPKLNQWNGNTTVQFIANA